MHVKHEIIITKKDLMNDLAELGVKSDDRIMLHSSLAAVGKIDSGAQGFIEAVMETIGRNGTLMMPSFSSPDRIFDRKTSACGLGIVPDTFWRMEGAIRSNHPLHAVAAWGRHAEDLISDHEKQETSCGEGTPYVKFCELGGLILLCGVDQDRNTILHSAEALADAPYLSSKTGSYIDDGGKIVTICSRRFPGAHRDFIGLDPYFRKAEIMTVGTVGNAVARLIDAKAMLTLATGVIRANPAAVLCDNPNCGDCTRQKGLIRKERLARERFTLAANFSDTFENNDVERAVTSIVDEGISHVEVCAQDAAVRASSEAIRDELKRRDVTVSNISVPYDRIISGELTSADIMIDADYWGTKNIVIGAYAGPDAALDRCIAGITEAGGYHLSVENGCPSDRYAECIKNNMLSGVGTAFNPSQLVIAGEKPFLGVFMKNTMYIRSMNVLYITDATFNGEYQLPEEGNAEVKEIVSICRAKQYEGIIVVRSLHERYRSAGNDRRGTFRMVMHKFNAMLDAM